MSTSPSLSTTSYAVLGLLAVRPWTTHELVQQVDHSLRRFWPRAQSKLYEEPRKLAVHGYAVAADDPVGRRKRTRWSITPSGRRALAAWVAVPGGGPAVEFEQLVKVLFCDSGTTADVVANLEATRAWVQRENAVHLETGRAYLEGRGAFPQRAALNQLGGQFLTDFYVMVDRWAAEALATVATWPADPAEAQVDPAAQRRLVAAAEALAGSPPAAAPAGAAAPAAPGADGVSGARRRTPAAAPRTPRRARRPRPPAAR